MSTRKHLARPPSASPANTNSPVRRRRPAGLQAGRKVAARGVAAIEFFLVLPLLLLILAFPLYLARYCYYYSVVHAAAYSTASYLSTIPLSDMTNGIRAPIVVTAAREIALEMLREPNAGMTQPLILADCVDHGCGGNFKPVVVRVYIEASVDDIFFSNVTQLRLPILVSVKLPYLGR